MKYLHTMVRVTDLDTSLDFYCGKLGLVEVSGTFDVGTATQQGAVDWVGAVAVGQLALGSELVGAARAMLELARTHALERIQGFRAR